MVKQSFASKNFNDEPLLNANIQLLVDPGVPTDIVDDGFIRIGGTSIYFRIGGAWAVVGGSPYVVPNYDGTVPSVLSSDSVAIGEGITIAADSPNAVAIGKDVNIEFSTEAIAIGNNAEVHFQTTLPGAGGIAIGNGTLVEDFDGIAIGNGTRAANEYAVIIGSNCNDTSGPGPQPTNAVVIGRDSNVTGTADNCVAIGREVILTGNNNIAIGYQASTGQEDCVLIGASASSFGNYGIAIGLGATVGDSGGSLPNGNEGIAIGRNASAEQSSSVQIGTGTNPNPATIQFLDSTIATAQGTAVEVLGTAPTAFALDGTLKIDGSTSTLYYRNLSSWNSIGGSSGGSSYTNDESTSGVAVNLTAASANRQFITPTADIPVVLPTTGLTNESYFLIANDDPGSGFNITVDTGSITQVLGNSSGINFVHCAFTGANWKLYA